MTDDWAKYVTGPC